MEERGLVIHPANGPALQALTSGQIRLAVVRSSAGIAADVAFRGRGYDHAIDIPGHGRLASVFAGTRANRGERVGLRLDPAGCRVFTAGANGSTVTGGPDSPDRRPVTEPGAVSG